MVNLIKFKADGGQAIYSEYVRAAAPAAEGCGAEVVYVGAAGADVAAGEDWDLVALVKYPSFDAFANVMTHPAYVGDAIPLREQAVERAVLMVSTPAGLIAESP